MKHLRTLSAKSPLQSGSPAAVELLLKGCQCLGVPLDQGKLATFLEYHDHLLSWNSRVNLISKADEARIVTHHFLDSLSAFPFIDFSSTTNLLDLGSGAGFPGLPLKIVSPNVSLTLLDSKRKKVLFLQSLINHLNLSDVCVLCERAENLGKNPHHQALYDLVLARAVSDLTSLVRLSWPLLRKGGALICYKGPDLSSEMADLKSTYGEELLSSTQIHRVNPLIDELTGKERTIVRIEI